MTRNEFLNILEKSLGNMPQADKEDILYDYREHFNAGLAEGKSEEDICIALGDPRTLARQYRADHIVKQADENRTASNIVRALFAAISLGFFNLVIILPVLASLVGVLLGFYAAAIGVTFSGIGVFLATILQNTFPTFISMPNINSGVLIFGSIGLTSLGLLLCIGDAYLTKFFYHITIKYIKANIRIISK